MESEKDIPKGANEDCPGTQSEQAGKQSSCDGCPMQQACSSGKMKEVDPEQIKIDEKMSQIKHKIFVLSGKGGVGKSTVSSQIAMILAQRGFNVGLMDIDICGPSIPRMLGLEKREVQQSNQGWSPVYLNENLGVMSIGNQDDAIIWRGPRKNGLIKQFLSSVNWDELDFLVIDTPPGTSDEHISVVQYLKSQQGKDGAVIVTTPQEVSLSDVRKELTFCKKTDVDILGVVENMSWFVCPNCSCQTEIFPPITGGAKKMCEDWKLDLLGNIPLDQQLLLSTEKGTSIVAENPNAKSSQAYVSIVDKLLTKLNEPLEKVEIENE